MARPATYTKADREHARGLYLKGDSTAEIAEVIGCTARTIRKWVADGSWDTELKDIRENEQNLESQIARLSKGNMTDSKAQRIAMLSRSLERLRKSRGKPKPPKLKNRVDATPDYLDLVNRCEEVFELYDYQRAFLLSEDRFECVLKSRQIGFSWILALRSLLRVACGRNQLIVSASQEQSDILIDYMINFASELGIAFDACSASEITIGSHFAKALPANQRTIQGFPGDIVLDEFAWQHKQKLIWRAVLPSITAVGGSVSVCSTPFMPGSLFWEICENHKGAWSHFARKRITIYDAIEQGMKVPGGLEELRQNFDSESWALMYECQWAEDGSALLSWELLHSIATASEQRIYDGPVRIGVDVGRTNDRTTIAKVAEEDKERDGKTVTTYRLLHVEQMKAKAFGIQRQAILDAARQYHVKSLKIDRTGLGMQLAEEVCQALPNVASGIHFTRQHKERMCLNMLKMAEDKRLVIPNDPALLSELHAIKRSATATGIKYDAARDESGHADSFWALAMAIDGMAKGHDQQAMAIIL